MPQLIGNELQLGRGDTFIRGVEFIQQRLDEGGLPGGVEDAGGFFEGGASIFPTQLFQPEADVHQARDDVFEGLQASEEVFAEDKDQAEVEAAVFVEFVKEAGGGGAFLGVVNEEELFELVEDDDDGAAEGALPLADGDEQALGRGSEARALAGFEQGAAHDFSQGLVGGRGASGDEGALPEQAGGDARVYQAAFAAAGFAVEQGEPVG